tara:strand:- start:697 stop:1299 length:603 start_codon:yes stop_codon:yes gene_type:complete
MVSLFFFVSKYLRNSINNKKLDMNNNFLDTKNKEINDYIVIHKLNQYNLFFESKDRKEFLKNLRYVAIRHVLDLDVLDDEELQPYVKVFFIHLLKHPLADYDDYNRKMLNYFHLREFLVFKRHIHNTTYRKLIKYKVNYKFYDKTEYIKHYTSLREISNDCCFNSQYIWRKILLFNSIIKNNGESQNKKKTLTEIQVVAT